MFFVGGVTDVYFLLVERSQRDGCAFPRIRILSEI
jgi:hypothetical protein